MVTETVRVQFSHFWPEFDPRSYFSFLSPHYDLTVCDEPDFVIFSCFPEGKRSPEMPRLRTDATRVFVTGENVLPDATHCEFSFSCHYPEHVGSDRHFRLPNYVARLWRWGYRAEDLLADPDSAEATLKAKTRFCNFVYSNRRCKIRNRLFHRLNRYKRVDAAGPLFNNTGGPLPPGVSPKLEYIRRHKFTVAFENESTVGYTTEKLIEAVLAGTVPIYWGNPRVSEEFNPRRFINFHDYGSMRKLIRHIKRVDQDDELYLSYLREPLFHDNRIPSHFDPTCVVNAFGKVFESRPCATS